MVIAAIVIIVCRPRRFEFQPPAMLRHAAPDFRHEFVPRADHPAIVACESRSANPGFALAVRDLLDKLSRMLQLTTEEGRVLGVLIEKGFTTPEQYPLSLNGLTAGCNQKSNRDPVLNLAEERVFDAVEGLREKQIAVRVDQMGSRVHKYRHNAGEILRCRAGEIAVEAELLLRGPQTLGELRGRASRMHPLATIEDVKQMLRGLMEREEPLVRELPPSPGSRAERYAQLLCPQSLPPAPAPSPTSMAAAARSQMAAPQTGSEVSAPELSERVAALEHQVEALGSALRTLAAAVGEPDPLDENLRENAEKDGGSTTNAE
jgi:uncharacterized protein YceH (UPF0502 family)